MAAFVRVAPSPSRGDRPPTSPMRSCGNWSVKVTRTSSASPRRASPGRTGGRSGGCRAGWRSCRVWTGRSVLERSGPVPVLNDAQAALLGEVWQGAAAGCANVVLLTLGTGVGGAAMVDGRSAARPPRPRRAPRAHQRSIPTARSTSSTRPAASKTRSATARSSSAPAAGSRRRTTLVERAGDESTRRETCGDRPFARWPRRSRRSSTSLDPE